MESLFKSDMADALSKAMPSVGFIDDVLRHAFWPAKEFFYDLLKVPFRRILPEPPRPSIRRLMWQDGLLTQPGVSPRPNGDEEDWIAQYNELSDGLKGVLSGYVDTDRLYISYEGSPGLLNWLTEIGVTWIDVRISPLRFMADVVVALRSNAADINAVLEQVTMTRADVETEAMLLSASWRHHDRYINPRPAIEGMEPLYYVGQTPNDASIVVGQSYFRLEDVIPDLAEELGQRDVVYLRHPTADPEHVQREVVALAQVSRSLTISDENSYDLLCADQPGEFFGISSGLLQEAPFFGRSALSMLPPVCPIRFPDEAGGSDTGYYQICFDTFIDDRFWSALFRREPVGWRDTPRTMRPNQLRELHNVWWGYAAHKARPTDYSRAQNREVRGEVKLLRNTTNFLLSVLSQRPDMANSLAHHLIAQRWRWVDGGEVSFGDDGAIQKNGRRCGTWRGVSGQPDTAMLIWDEGGWMDLAELDPAGTRLKCRNNAGEGFTVTAI